MTKSQDKIAESQGCYFDPGAAARAASFFSNVLRVPKGPLAGEPFHLLAWQREIVERLFGWKRKDGTRRYRTAYIEIPKKNGKSNFIGGLANLLLAATAEPQPEVYIAAGSRDQCRHIYSAAAQTASMSPTLKQLTQQRDSKQTIYKAMKSKGKAQKSGYIKCVSADAGLQEGLDASAVLFDELHVQKNRKLYDTLKYATAARKQPLTIYITTAGSDKQSVCFTEHVYAQSVINGDVEDTSYLGVIYAAHEDDDIGDPATWKKANPSMGITIQEEEMRAAYERAKDSPAELASFKRYRLNLWSTNEAQQYISPRAWARCQTEQRSGAEQAALLDDYSKRNDYAIVGGVDISVCHDLTALCFLAVPLNDSNVFDMPTRDKPIVPYIESFVPGSNIDSKAAEDGVDYRAWQAQGWCRLTRGNSIDRNQIQDRLLELYKRWRPKTIGIDPASNGKLIAQSLENDHGVPTISYSQYPRFMGPPVQSLLSYVLDETIDHGGNGLLTWNINSMVVIEKENNIKPVKTKRHHRIDAAVALIIAIGTASTVLSTAKRQEKELSSYDLSDYL